MNKIKKTDDQIKLTPIDGDIEMCNLKPIIESADKAMSKLEEEENEIRNAKEEERDKKIENLKESMNADGVSEEKRKEYQSEIDKTQNQKMADLDKQESFNRKKQMVCLVIKASAFVAVTAIAVNQAINGATNFVDSFSDLVDKFSQFNNRQ